MKLSRKRPVAGPQKEAASASATEAAGVAKKGQTKISRFFSKSLLPSLSDKATKLFQEKSEAKPEPEVDASAVAAPLPPAVAAAAFPLLPAVIIENGENDVRLVSQYAVAIQILDLHIPETFEYRTFWVSVLDGIQNPEHYFLPFKCLTCVWIPTIF